MDGAWDGHDTRGSTTGANTARAALAEAVGTFLLVLVGTAVATAAVLGKNTAGPAYDSLAIALSFGLALTAIVATLGPVSGAHVNPAVTLSLAVTGTFPWRAVPAYIAAQVGGAVLAALAVWGVYGQRAYDVARLGAPAPVHGATDLQVFLVEALIAALLVVTVVAVPPDPRVPARSAPLAVGFALAAGVLIGGPVSGGAGNPARALGPMLVSGMYQGIVLYILGPLVGGIVAAVYYDRAVAATPAPQTEPASAPHIAPKMGGAARVSDAAWARAKRRVSGAAQGGRLVKSWQVSPVGQVRESQGAVDAVDHIPPSIVPNINSIVPKGERLPIPAPRGERLPIAIPPNGFPHQRPRHVAGVAGVVALAVLSIGAVLVFLRRDGAQPEGEAAQALPAPPEAGSSRIFH